MTTAEMHVLFRELAQRAGMQEVADIRTEQIDLHLNIGATGVALVRIQQSTADVDSRSVSTLIKTGQSNDFRTLWKEEDLPITKGLFLPDYDEFIVGKIVSNPEEWPISDALVYYDYHVNYATCTGAWTKDGGVPTVADKPSWVSPKKKMRLIEHNYLGNTLADNILKPNIRNPIILVKSVTPDDGVAMDIDSQQVAMYFGAFDDKGQLGNGLSPYKLCVGYYRKPATILYGEDVNDETVNCDLPVHLHLEVVQSAVNNYLMAKTGGSVRANGNA